MKLTEYFTSARTSRLSRIWSNEELKKIAHLFQGDIVNVSGWDDRDKQGDYYKNYFSSKDEYYITNLGIGERGYQNQHNEIELDLTNSLPDDLFKRFSVVYNHTTLEHIFDVLRAFENICNMSKDIVIIVVPFAQNEHGQNSWGDYWRFCPGALRELFSRHGFYVIYESESPFRNAGIYLFFVASRFPNKWEHLMPPHSGIKKAGTWIGKAWLPKVFKKITSILKIYNKK